MEIITSFQRRCFFFVRVIFSVHFVKKLIFRAIYSVYLVRKMRLYYLLSEFDLVRLFFLYFIKDKSRSHEGIYLIEAQTQWPDLPAPEQQNKAPEKELANTLSQYETDCLNYIYKLIYSDYEKISRENIVYSTLQDLLAQWFQQVLAYKKENSPKAFEVLFRIGSNICFVAQEYLSKIDTWVQSRKENQRMISTTGLGTRKGILTAILRNELVIHELVGKFCLSIGKRMNFELNLLKEDSFEVHSGSEFYNFSMFELVNNYMTTSIPSNEMLNVLPKLKLNTKHYNSAYPIVDNKRHHAYKKGSYTFSNVNVENFLYESLNQHTLGGLNVVYISCRTFRKPGWRASGEYICSCSKLFAFRSTVRIRWLFYKIIVQIKSMYIRLKKWWSVLWSR